MLTVSGFHYTCLLKNRNGRRGGSNPAKARQYWATKDENRNKTDAQNVKDTRKHCEIGIAPQKHESASLWSFNSGEQTARSHYFGLLSPWPFLRRSDILLHVLVEPLLSLPQSISWTLLPLFRRFVSFILVQGCDCPLFSVDAESSDIVQKTSHPLFFMSPGVNHILRELSEHHTLGWVVCQTKRTGSDAYAMSPWCSYVMPGCCDGIWSIYCDYAFANRCRGISKTSSAHFANTKWALYEKNIKPPLPWYGKGACIRYLRSSCQSPYTTRAFPQRRERAR